MAKVELIALKSHHYGARRSVNDRYFANTERDANLLVGLKRARRAVSSDSQPAPAPAPATPPALPPAPAAAAPAASAAAAPAAAAPLEAAAPAPGKPKGSGRRVKLEETAPTTKRKPGRPKGAPKKVEKNTEPKAKKKTKDA